MAAALTYTSLLADLQKYGERDDKDFVDQLPRFVAQAESRIATEARGLGFMRSVTDDMQAGRTFITKPARWRETVSINIGTGAGFRNRQVLFARGYEYCREFWPDVTKKEVPKYYAEWDYHHWLLVPTPDLSYPYEVIYHERPRQLDESTQSNWTTQYAPQLLLYACLLEMQPFIKRDDRIAVFQQEYDRAIKQVEFDQQRRGIDRSSAAEE